MAIIKLAELEHTNSGLHKGRMGGGDHSFGMLLRNCITMNWNYADTFDRVFFAITKFRDAYQMMTK